MKLSKHYSSYCYDSFIPCDSPHRNCFLGFWNFKFKLKKKDRKLTLCPIERWKMANISQMANRWVKLSAIWDSRVVVTYIWDTFDFLVFKIIWGHSMHLAQNGLRLEKGNCRGVKQTEIWESCTVVIHVWGTLDLLVLNVILGSFSALVSKWPLTRKQLALEQNWLKFGILWH